jgi:LacI family transcriptional regulator
MIDHSKQEPVTQKQVAQDAGVSQSTVTLVLQGSSSIPGATRERVLSSMQKLGYVYNRGAANLRTNDSSLMGLIISDPINPFYSEVLIGIQSELTQSGAIVLFGSTFESLASQEQLISSMLEHRVRGIMLFPVPGTTREHILKIERLGAAAVLVSRSHPELFCDQITTDDVKGGQMATEHLILGGHRRIAFLGGLPESQTWRGRKKGYERALRRAGLPVDPSLVINGPYSREDGTELIRRVLELQDLPTALFFYNDDLAIGGMLALKKKRLMPGRDLAIVGFDGIPEGELFNPGLTTVKSSPQLMGTNAVRLLRMRIEDPGHKLQTIVLKPELIVRESSSGNKQLPGKITGKSSVR